MDRIREFIVKRIKEAGLTMAEISRQMNRNPAYIQQFLSRETPKELEEEDRLVLARILGVDANQLKGPGRPRKWSRTVPLRPIKNLDLEIATRHLRKAKNIDEVATLLKTLRLHSDALLSADSNVPYYFSVPLPSGGIKIASYARFRAPKLLTTLLSEHSYFLLISDDILPDLRRGAIAFVDPSITPDAGMICILRKRSSENGGEAYIRQILEVTEEHFRVSAKEVVKASKNSVNGLRQPFEDFSQEEWRADIVIGNLFPPVT
jgi:lambda repressor-like predicted transcriptional regulator